MFEFSIVSHGANYDVECYNSNINAVYLLYSSRDRALVLRLYRALLAANKKQVTEIMRGWTGRADAVELRRMEDILNAESSLYYEPRTNHVLNTMDLYKEYKLSGNPITYTDYVTSRLRNKTLKDRIPLVPEGGRRAYVATFV